MVKVTYKVNMKNLVHQPPIPVVTGWWRILSLVYMNNIHMYNVHMFISVHECPGLWIANKPVKEVCPRIFTMARSFKNYKFQ